MDKTSKSFVIQWNNEFPLDNWYRKKYNIPFNSKTHRKINQIDIYLEWIEDSEYAKLAIRDLQKDVKMENYLTPQENQEQLKQKEIDAFDKLDIADIKI